MTEIRALNTLEAAVRKFLQTPYPAAVADAFWDVARPEGTAIKAALIALDLARKEETEKCPTCHGSIYYHPCPDCCGTGKAKVTLAAPLAGELEEEP